MENEIKLEKKGEKVMTFLKKYGYFIAAGLVVIGITLAVLLTTVNPVVKNREDDVIDTNVAAITFINPLLDCSVIFDYSIDKLLWNTTLGWYETHSGIDLVSNTSPDVLAVSAGTVTDIYTNGLEGTVIVIKHNNEYSTLYGSLDSAVNVNIGDSVISGQKIGTISTSAGNESSIGAHLHFELLKDNSNVDPNDYLNLENK